jgi:5-methylcytosine-specific restriction endonuclease McrA
MVMIACLACGQPAYRTRWRSCQSAFDRTRNHQRHRMVYRSGSFQAFPIAGRPCAICGANPAVSPSRDHIISVTEGLMMGMTMQQLNDWSNLQVASRACNSRRGSGWHMP